MDIKKVSFEVDASQIDIKPLLKKEFLELTMRPISTANPNRNNSWFTRESLEASIDTFKNKPILGYFENGDFVSHNGEWREDPETDLDYWDTVSGKGERPLGLIRGDDEVKIIDDESTGLSWVVLTCALWTQYNYKQVKRLLQDAKRAQKQGGPTKNVSVEVDITNYEILPNGVMKINAFNLVGITILGSRNGVKVEPGIADAELSVVDIMGTALYEKQVQSLRLAYEKLDGSENNKEDFSKMEDNIQENSPVVEETIAVVEEVVEATEESSQEAAHFEENHDNETSEPEENAEQVETPVVHENEEALPEEAKCEEAKCEEEHCEEDGEEEDDDGEEEDKEEGKCPECGQEPCVCEQQEEALEPEEEKCEEHCDCGKEAYEELLCKYEALVKECDALKAERDELQCALSEMKKAEEHKQFVADAKVIIANAKLTEEMTTAFEKSCEEGTIATLEELKAQIGLKLYEIKSAEEAPVVKKETSTFDAPINKPNTDAFIDKDTNNKKKSKWDALREFNRN